MINFTKMQGLGNDFVVIDNSNGQVEMTAGLARQLADRHYGVGCDQVLLLEKSTCPTADFLYRIFNADGSEVSQCGNGARCIGLFVKKKNLSDKQMVTLETARGEMTVSVVDEQHVKVSMGVPKFEPACVPYMPEAECLPYDFDVVSVGNPHGVLLVDDFESLDHDRTAIDMNQSACFPDGVNVGFMQIISRRTIDLRVIERGAGATQACGSGACAAMVIGYQQGLLDATVTVQQPGGNVDVTWQGEGYPVYLQGPAALVFDGVYGE